jgi:hypothetical protein
METFATIHINVRRDRVLEIVKKLSKQFLGEGWLGVR